MSGQQDTPRRPRNVLADLRRRWAREALERGEHDVARELEPESPLAELRAEADDDQPWGET